MSICVFDYRDRERAQSDQDGSVCVSANGSWRGFTTESQGSASSLLCTVHELLWGLKTPPLKIVKKNKKNIPPPPKKKICLERHFALVSEIDVSLLIGLSMMTVCLCLFTSSEAKRK